MKKTIFKNKFVQILCLFIGLFATVALLTQMPAWLEYAQANAETQGVGRTQATTLPAETQRIGEYTTQPTTDPTVLPSTEPTITPTIQHTTAASTTPAPTTPAPTTAVLTTPAPTTSEPTTVAPTTPAPTTPAPTTAASTTPAPTTAIPTTPTPTTQPPTQPTVPTGPVNPQNIVNNFGSNPKTDRNFTWITAKNAQPGFVEYCRLTDFTSFEADNILREPAITCLSDTNIGFRFIHKASLKNLQPGTEYVYRVGGGSGYSPQGVFKTEEASLQEFTFISTTDTQGASEKDYAAWNNTLETALKKFPDARFLLHTGDMVDDGESIWHWNQFMNSAKDTFMKLPILPVVGNHEANNKIGKNVNLKNFTDSFNLPDAGLEGIAPGTVYSIDYGEAHIAVLNTHFTKVSELRTQMAWLREDMSNSDKTWKLVAFHRSPYGGRCYADAGIFRSEWAPVFDELGIDLILTGHDHNYVRTYPLKGGKVVDEGKGTVYMVGNTGGVKFYDPVYYDFQQVCLQPKTQIYFAVTVSGSQLAVNVFDVIDNLVDTLTLKK